MIHKIERLVSIGKFRNYQASGDVAFGKLTLIYGDNGAGKTTLTAILRSLTLADSELIKRRKSVNDVGTQQAAQIFSRFAGTTTNTTHTFHYANGWSAPYTGVEIFDTHFVNENVYSGFEFNDEHRKRLHQFVIGAQGVAIQKQIEENKALKTASRQTQNELEQQIIGQVGGNLTSADINSFLSISPTDATDIDDKIRIAEAALVSANAKSTLQTLQTLKTLTPITTSMNFEGIISDLQATSLTLQDETLTTVYTHHCQDLSDHSITRPENWLHTGFGYVQRKRMSNPSAESVTCPFCKQLISGQSEIIRTYTAKFDAAFNALVQRIQQHIEAIRQFNLDLKIIELNAAHTANSSAVSSWKPHLASIQDTEFDILGDEAELREQLSSFAEDLQKKRQNPTIAIDTAAIDVFRVSILTINGRIEAYNRRVVEINATIEGFKRSIQTVSQATLSASRLSRIKKRFETSIVTLCDQLIFARQSLRQLENAYPGLVSQQDAAATAFFSTYSDRINYYLINVFKTHFRIENVVHIPPQGMAAQSKIGYRITIDGQDISFDSRQGNSVKECLSEGDKSTIALAFFLSKVDIDSGIVDKTLIFDDPLSSFDANRRLNTVLLIKELFAQVRQIVVFSHNEFFLHELYKLVGPSEKKVLRISENFTTRSSTIEPLDLDALVENQYFKHVKELERFLAAPDLSNKDIVLGWMRNVLEAHIRFKFYRQLTSIPPNGQTFGTIVSKLVQQNVPFRDNTNRIAIIAKLNMINAISSKPHHGEAAPDYASLGVDPATITTTELAGFVTDTLALIDTQL